MIKFVTVNCTLKTKSGNNLEKAPPDPIEVPAGPQVDLQRQTGAENFFVNAIASSVSEVISTGPLVHVTTANESTASGDAHLNAVATSFPGITSPVYFEVKLSSDETTQDDLWTATEFLTSVGSDVGELIRYVAGDTTERNFGGFLAGFAERVGSVNIGDPDYNLSAATVAGVDVVSDRNYAAAGWGRLGVTYDPATGFANFEMFFENGVTLQYATSTSAGLNPGTNFGSVAKFSEDGFRQHEDAPLDTLQVCMFTTTYNVPGSILTSQLITRSEDFLNPNGIPDGFTALHNVNGSRTSEYLLGDYIQPE